MAGSGYPMVAAHDRAIIDAVPGMVSESGRSSRRFRIPDAIRHPDDEQRRLADAGNQVRVYVPFGAQWYEYFMRRLAERLANLAFFLRALAQRGH
jgi:proline dehydrogenase